MSFYNVLKLSIVFFLNLSYSQVGINTTTPHSSAILDIESNNKGVLIPRVSLTGSNDLTTISSPANGLLVYNLADANTGVNKVYKNTIYYYDGDLNKWSTMLSDVLVNNLNIPRLGNFVYKTNTQTFTELSGGLNVIDFATAFAYFGYGIEFNGASTTEFHVKETGFYSFNGFANWLLDIPGSDPNNVSYWTVAMQVKDSDASTWGGANSLDLGMRCMYNNVAVDLTQPCNFTGAVLLSQGNIIRMVALKKNGVNPSGASLQKSTSLGVPYSAGFTTLFFPL